MAASRGRPSGAKTRCGGRWTEARFKSFIVSALRSASRKWGPIGDSQKAARVRRGMYLCASCKQTVPASIQDGRKKVKNVHVDHIDPVVCPNTGFIDWNTYVDRMFVEEDNLQVLCKACHDDKCLEETQLRKRMKDAK